MKTQLISALIFAAAVIGLIYVLMVNPFATPSKKEAALQVRYEVATQNAKRSFKEAAQLRQQAKELNATLDKFREQLKTNRYATDKAVSTIATLQPDSLAGHIAATVYQLDTAWY